MVLKWLIPFALGTENVDLMTSTWKSAYSRSFDVEIGADQCDVIVIQQIHSLRIFRSENSVFPLYKAGACVFCLFADQSFCFV